jgi:hypothetical protein
MLPRQTGSAGPLTHVAAETGHACLSFELAAPGRCD